MKVAYLILAHNEPLMLDALIAALGKPEAQIFVHIDKKADIIPFEKLLINKCTFIEPRINISWGRFSMIQATLNLLKYASSTHQFDYYCLLSGCDYPIKSIHSFENYLTEKHGNEFINCKPIAEMSARFKKRYNGFYLFENKTDFFKKINYAITKIQRIFYKRKPYNNQPIFFGSQWWTLTGECIACIMNFLAEHPDYINYFKYTHIPDEMFFQTLIGNSPFADRIQKNNLRYIVFNDKTLLHPKILTINDKDMLMQSSAFFARKFDLRKDAEIIECLKEFVYEQNP